MRLQNVQFERAQAPTQNDFFKKRPPQQVYKTTVTIPPAKPLHPSQQRHNTVQHSSSNMETLRNQVKFTIDLGNESIIAMAPR